MTRQTASLVYLVIIEVSIEYNSINSFTAASCFIHFLSLELHKCRRITTIPTLPVILSVLQVVPVLVSVTIATASMQRRRSVRALLLRNRTCTVMMTKIVMTMMGIIMIRRHRSTITSDPTILVPILPQTATTTRRYYHEEKRIGYMP